MCLPDFTSSTQQPKTSCMYKETPPNGYGWNKPTNWNQQKHITIASIYIPMNQLLDVQPKNWHGKERMCFFRWAQNLRCLRIIHRLPSGQPWSRLNLLPSEALRRATHVRRLQFRSGEPWGNTGGWNAETPGGKAWCKVGNATKALEVVGWFNKSLVTWAPTCNR